MKNLQSLISLQECSGRNVGQSAAKHGNDTATTRQRHGNGLHRFRIVTLLLLLLTIGVGQMWGEDLYVPGYGGNWSTNANQMTGTASPWTFYAYWSSAQEFKIHNGSSWIGCTTANPTSLTFGTQYTLTTGGGNNMKFSSVPGDGGRYKITVTKSGSTYYLTATKEVEEGGTAYSISSSPYIYFNVAAATSAYTAASILLGKSDGSQDYAMSGKITGTQLFYKQMPNWSNYKTFLFIAANNWGGSWNGEKVTQRIGGVTNTNTYNTGMSGNYHMFTVASGDDNASLTYASQTSYGALLNKTQTIEVYVKAAGGSYTKKTSSWPGTLTPDRYYMSSATATTHEDNTALTASSSVTVSAAITSAFSLSESETATGYTFDGWGTSSGSTPSGASSPYSISSIAGANTICAFFSENKYTVTINNDGNGSTSPSEAQSNVGQVTGIAIEATPDDNYEFVNWTIESGTGSFDDATDESTTFYPTSAATIQANFRSTLTNSLTVVAGTGISSVTGSTDPVTLGTKYNISATVATGYTFSTWTADPVANGAFDAASSASTKVQVNNGSVTVTASATENMSSLSTSCHYDAGNPSYSAPTVSNSATNVGYATTRTITATAAGTGYTFVGWTLTNCTRTDGGGATANPITIRSNGDGAAATVVANYEEDRSSRWHLVGQNDTGYEIFPDGWTVSNTSMMQKATGHSTESVVYCSVDVATAGGRTYLFKIVDDNGASDDIWYGYSTGDTYLEWTATSTKNVYSGDGNGNNLKFTPSIVGTYEFKVDYSGTYPAVTITYPTVYAITGDFNSWTEETNLAFTGNDGSYSVSIDGSGTNYEFKVIDNAIWYGHSNKTFTATESNVTLASGSNNIKLKADVYPNGSYTFAYNKSTHELGVTYPTNYVVTFGKRTGGNAITAKINNTTSFSSGTKIKSGTSVTFAQTALTGYTFEGWYNAESGGTRVSTSSSYTTTISAATTVYSNYTPNDYTITLDKNTGGSNGTVTATYNSSSTKSFTAVTKTGYNCTGYWTASSGGYKVINADGTIATYSSNISSYINSSRQWIKTTTPTTLYAQWTPKTYTVTLDDNGGSADGTATATYDATSLTDKTAPTKTGYHVEGYYDDDELTNKVATDGGALQANVTGFTGAGGIWTKDANATLYTKWTANTYTIAFNDNDENYLGTATGTTASMADVEYDEEVELTDNGFSLAHYSFDGWATTPTGTVAYSDGEEVSNLSSTDGATVTLYAKWTGDSYTVSFNKGAGTSLSASSSTVQYGSTYGEGSGLGGNMPTVTAPSGYVFSGWYDAPTGGAKIDESSVVTATTDHTLYARYTRRDRVYFYNNLGWSDVYVTYDAYWDNSNGTGSYGKIYHHMTQIGSSNIWYDDIPSSVLSDWKYFIAFNSKQLGTVGESGTWGNFDSGEAVYRHDFDSYATMFVPAAGDTWKKNSNKCTYQSSSWTYDAAGGGHGENYRHSTGYWMRYNDTKSGYAITGTWDSWANTTDFQAENAGDDIYTVTKTLAANTTYDFLLYKDYSTNTFTHVYTYTTAGITSASCTDLSLTTNGTKYSELASNHAQITTTTAGEYVFKLTPDMNGVLKLSVEYPFAVNDYRVTYAWNDGSAHSHSSEIIKAAAGTNETISVFVHKAANVTSQSLTIEKCTGINGSGVATWTAGNTITLSSEDITANGVYNFIITQPASGEPTGAFWKKYDGKYYIRTESSDGGWNYYKDYEDNIMTYSDYSMTQTLSDPYSHYYCRYIENTGMDITYQIATDYSPCVSDIFVGDATIGGVGNTTLPDGNPANIRFSWNEQTNAMRRAYLKSAQGAGNSRYLVMHGYDNKIRNNDATGTEIAASGDLAANELQFTDNGNWVYQVSLKAMPGAQVSLIAKYNGSDRYLVGDGDENWMTIIDGKGSNKYEIAAVYDFKTNRLMTAWTPNDSISDQLTDVDLMLIRHAQDAATSITFKGNGSLEAKKVIGALRMDYDELRGKVFSWTSSSRPLLKFFISFPFDVYVSDVFGLNSAYGDAYVIQRYAGDERARKGFFRGDGTTSFWTDLTTADTLHANVGYCVILDNDYFNGNVGSVWLNKAAGSSVYLYFPSASDVGDIESTEKTITVPAQECKIDRPFGAGKNHMNTDSHWNLMGVPIFNDHTGVSTAGTPGAIFVTTGDQSKDCHYFYEWSTSNNQFSIRAALGYVFKSMHSYMVQYTGDVTFTGSAIPSSVAPRKQQLQSYTIELNVLNSNADMLNRTYVELREEACDTFELNEDVYMSTNTNAVNIYTFAGSYEAAANVLSIANHTIPVGVEVRTAGTYTISMPNSFRGTATLIDKQTGVRTNLAISDYEVELPKGTINDRFELEISDISNVITDIEYTNGEGSLKDGKAHKFIRNGLLYIVRDSKVYDARGAKVE